MKIGVFPGKFIPFHRGHLASILIAHGMVDKLYVVICGRDSEDKLICASNKLNHITLKLREKWISKELQGFDNIEILSFDEETEGIEKFPFGWEKYSKHLKKIIPESIDVIFGGEEGYRENHNKYFPDIIYQTIDPNRTKWPISATEIRNNPIKYWDFIVGSARDFFVKKILITGVESCGKTTLTKKLAKLYNTSRSEEYGRYYSRDFLGGNEKVFANEDFEHICRIQVDQDIQAINTANKVVFFDTDPLVTYYYNKLYLGCSNEKLLHYVNPKNYDTVLYLTPEVKWVDDGLRFIKEQEKRNVLSQNLLKMYQVAGYKNIYAITGEKYSDRLNTCVSIIDSILEGVVE